MDPTPVAATLVVCVAACVSSWALGGAVAPGAAHHVHGLLLLRFALALTTHLAFVAVTLPNVSVRSRAEVGRAVRSAAPGWVIDVATMVWFAAMAGLVEASDEAAILGGLRAQYDGRSVERIGQWTAALLGCIVAGPWMAAAFGRTPGALRRSLSSSVAAASCVYVAVGPIPSCPPRDPIPVLAAEDVDTRQRFDSTLYEERARWRLDADGTLRGDTRATRWDCSPPLESRDAHVPRRCDCSGYLPPGDHLVVRADITASQFASAAAQLRAAGDCVVHVFAELLPRHPEARRSLWARFVPGYANLPLRVIDVTIPLEIADEPRALRWNVAGPDDADGIPRAPPSPSRRMGRNRAAQQRRTPLVVHVAPGVPASVWLRAIARADGNVAGVEFARGSAAP